MTYKTAIFDLDGTLLDTLEDIANSVNYALEKHTFNTHSHDIIMTFIGSGVRNLIEQACPNGTSDIEIENVLKSYTEHYAVHKNDNTKPFDGVLELLDELKARGVKLAILSNKPDKATKALAKDLFSDTISYAKGATDDMPIKPAPHGILDILKNLNASAKTTVFIGDSDVDILTGKNASLYTVGVSWGFRPVSELIENGASKIVDKPSEILELF